MEGADDFIVYLPEEEQNARETAQSREVQQEVPSDVYRSKGQEELQNGR